MIKKDLTHTHVSRVAIWAAHHVLLLDEQRASTYSTRPIWRLPIHGHGPLEGALRSWANSWTPCVEKLHLKRRECVNDKDNGADAA